ncbi:MAG: zf-HC2 domain-containing protein, partial [Micromonosporaceae bacterium]
APATAPATDTDTDTDTDNSTLATQAFHTLPERWQLVLWHTDIEAEDPTTIAPLLGLTPNGVTALAYRARERLRQAYLQARLTESPPTAACATVAPLLAAEIRGSLSARDQAKVGEHLDSCDSCTALHAELGDLSSQIVPLLAPAVLGPTWAQYLGMSTASKSGVAAWFSATWLSAAWYSAAPGRLIANSGGQVRRLSEASNGRRNTAIGAGTVAAAAALAVVLLTNGTATPPPQTPPAAGPPEPPASPPLPTPDDPRTPRPDREPSEGPAAAVPPADRPAASPRSERPPVSSPPAPPPSTPPPSTPPGSPPGGPTPPRLPWLPDLPALPGLPAIPGLPGLSEPPVDPQQPHDPDRPPGLQGRDHPGAAGEPGTSRHGQRGWGSRRGDPRPHRGDHRGGRPDHRSVDRGGPKGSSERPGRTR